MATNNIVQNKSYNFALNVVLIYKKLHQQNEFVLSRQLVRSATSIGANIEEGIQAQSKPDFIHKFSIAQKESYEALYWLRLMEDAKYLKSEEVNPLKKQCLELQKLITSIIKTTKERYIKK
ncbi:MAG: four helix bundle protein [Bacteroidota bacterium]|jgi:four helix bundle protein